MTPIEKTKLQFDLQSLCERIEKCKRIPRDLKEFTRYVIDRAEKAMDDEPLNDIHGWKGTDL